MSLLLPDEDVAPENVVMTSAAQRVFEGSARCSTLLLIDCIDRSLVCQPNHSFFRTTTISFPMSSKPSLSIPPPSESSFNPSATPKTPRTPADEALTYFTSPTTSTSSPVRVFELPLEPDGGPNKERSYVRLPPAYEPYVLRVVLEAGTAASRNGVFKTNFPLDGGVFERNKFVERRYVAETLFLLTIC
jgi:hypothetical protein